MTKQDEFRIIDQLFEVLEQVPLQERRSFLLRAAWFAQQDEKYQAAQAKRAIVAGLRKLGCTVEFNPSLPQG